MVTAAQLEQLANWKEGLISPAVLFDQDLYELEQEKVFGHSWVVVGHEDMVRKPGDYFTNYLGEVPVIITRDQAGEVHVLVNRCAHRGNEVCLYDRGNASSFTCSYHGWAYDLSGRLIGVPLEREIYRNELNRGDWGLEEVAQVANFKGLLFATFDPEAPSIQQWIGEDGCWWLENFVLGGPIGGLEALPGWHRYNTPGNWKHLAENFIGDSYHVMAATHVAWFKVVADFAQQGKLDWRTAYPRPSGPRYEAATGFGSGCPVGYGGVQVGPEGYKNDLEQAHRVGPEAIEWVEHRHHEYEKALGRVEDRPYSFMNGGIFPNLGLMGFNSAFVGRHFLHFHPRGPWEMEQWQWTMVEKEAPQSVKDVAIQRVYQGQHMAGAIAPDDVENLERIVEAMRSPRNWRRPHHYGLQLGHEQEGPAGLPGIIGPNPSEVNQRNFYRFWLELMGKGLSMVGNDLKREIEEFLYREAYLLDEYRFEEWLDLFTDDIQYIMPLRENVQGDVEPAGHPIINDDKLMLTMRVKKNETGISHVEIPQSMTAHLVTNILVDEGPSPEELRVISTFLVRQARKLRDEAWWVGRRRDAFRRVDGAWKIARREIQLDSTVLPRGISIFL